MAEKPSPPEVAALLAQAKGLLENCWGQSDHPPNTFWCWSCAAAKPDHEFDCVYVTLAALVSLVEAQAERATKIDKLARLEKLETILEWPELSYAQMMLKLCEAIASLRLDAAKLKAENARLRAALENLTTKLREVFCHPSYQAVWTIAHVHGFVYDGPHVSVELDAAEAALTSPPTGETL